MQKLFSLLILLASITLASADTLVKESFATFTGSYTSAATVTLPTGEWKACGVGYNKSNGVIAVKFNAADSYLVTPLMENVGKISFAYRSGGSNKPVTLSYSTDGGTSWITFDEFVIKSSSSSFATYQKTIALADGAPVVIKIACTASNVYVKDFCATLDVDTPDSGSGQLPSDPTYDPSGTPIPTQPFTTPLHTYYISPMGNDVTGDGSFEHPWYNIAVAYGKAEAGDHIVCRGGTYHISHYASDGKLTVRMNKQGTALQPIVIRSYEDEIPVFDFEQQLLDCHRDRSKVGDRGVLLSGDYHVIFGIHFMHAADNAIKLEGSHNRIERCTFSYNLDTGLQLGFGHRFADSFPGMSKNDGSYCAYNDVIDCDSHHNCDYDQNYGSDADGFACKMHNGKGNRFIRCRAWRNGDDAWDLYETDYSVVLAECWAWESGKAEDHLWVKEYFDGSASFSGNGNGIKLGGNGTGGSSMGIHYAYNCISFGHNKSGSTKGFDCNSHKDGHVLIGCLGFDSGYDFMFESGGSATQTFFYNNICLGRQEICVGIDDYNAITTPPTKNAWSHHLLQGVSADDFVSLAEEDALKPRSADGSLPREFGRLRAGSSLIDAGTSDHDLPESLVADFPFLRRTITGNGRDLGPYEFTDYSSSLPDVITTLPQSADDACYDLTGRRVDATTPGIKIRGGKRVVVF